MKIVEWIRNLFAKKSRLEVELLNGIDLSNEETIHQRMEDITRKGSENQSRYEKILEQLSILKRMDYWQEEELEELESLAKDFSDTVLEHETFQKIVQSQNKEPNYLEKYKDEMANTISQMEEHEKKRSLIKRDLQYLESEKAEIHYKMNRIHNGLKATKMLLLLAVFTGAIAAFILTTMYFVYGFDVFIGALSVALILFFVGLWVIIFRRYLIHEMNKNLKLQKREVELTNKTKIKYVNVQQFLDYEYKKFHVNSSEMLQLRWENYQKNAMNEEKFKKLSKNMEAVRSDLNRLLMRNEVDELEFILEHIDYFTSKKGRKMLGSTLQMENDQIKSDIDKWENEKNVLSKVVDKEKTTL